MTQINSQKTTKQENQRKLNLCFHMKHKLEA